MKFSAILSDKRITQYQSEDQTKYQCKKRKKKCVIYGSNGLERENKRKWKDRWILRSYLKDEKGVAHERDSVGGALETMLNG